MERPKTGLYFGSFDPIHLGHLIIAEHLQNQGALDEIWFVLSPQNPLKTGRQLTQTHLRMQMLQLAIENNPAFSICDAELHMPPPHYTLRTLKKLQEKHPEKDFVLIIGSDNLEVFDQWKDYNLILEQFPVWVYPRPGYPPRKFLHFSNLKLQQAPLLEISSTHIRESFATGRPARYMLPQLVYQYISENRLYGA